MVRAIPTRMLYTLIIHLWIPPCDSSNGLRNLYYYITGRFFTSRALGNASACPSPPAPLGDLYQIVIKTLLQSFKFFISMKFIKEILLFSPY